MNENTARDRAENPKLSYEVELFDVEGGRPLSIEAMEDGILVDHSHVIPWEWIQEAMAEAQIAVLIPIQPVDRARI